MPEPRELRRTLAALVDQDARRRSEWERVRDRERLEQAGRRANFERVAAMWKTQQILPRLATLIDLLPARGELDARRGSLGASASFPWSAEFPVSASLTISITPVDDCRSACVGIEPLLIPMLQGHPPAIVRDLDLDADFDLAQFLDRGVLDFARSLLHVRDPESPYQVGWRWNPARGTANSVATASMSVRQALAAAGSAP